MQQTQNEQLQGFNTLIDALSEKVAEKVCERMEPMMKGSQADPLLTKKEVMERLHVTEATLWRWEKMGILQRAGTFGTRVYYKLSDVENALEESKKKQQ